MFDDIIEKSDFTLLYAEDEPEVRNVYKIFFENYFKKVLVAENGTEAIEQYTQNKPEVIVLDILMPELNGIEVAKKIREHDKDAIIIIMTANDTKEWLYASVELGLKKFIKKGTKKFTDFEAIILDIIEELEKKTNNEEDKDIWQITPKKSNPEIAFDCLSHKLYMNGEVINLSKKLIEVIYYFSQNRDRIISHKELINELWGEDSGKTADEQKIRSFLYTIKKKIGIDIFKSHYKQGYTIEIN